MRQDKKQVNRERVDAAFKIAGLVILTLAIEFVSRGKLLPALGLFAAGALTVVIPLYFEKRESTRL